MTDAAVTDLDLVATLDDTERTFQMDEDAFRAFYELTARPLWLYLARVSGNDRLADDLLQETYYRFLRATVFFTSDDHRRHYLFRVATNLVRDHHRRPRKDTAPLADDAVTARDIHAETGESIARRIDLSRAMQRLKPRERSLLWLAYAQGWSHEEMAGALGLKASSLKTLLHRARRRLMSMLGTSNARGRRS